MADSGVAERALGRSALHNHPLTSLIIWGLTASLLTAGVLEIGFDLRGLVHFSGWQLNVAPPLIVAPAEKPLQWALSLIAGGSVFTSSLLLLFGSRRRHLHLALLGIWVWLPLRFVLLFLWHLVSLWYRDIAVYDQDDWIGTIVSVFMMALLVTGILWIPGPMRRRFPKPSEDVAAIF